LIPGLALLSVGGLLLWRGFTGRSPFDEIGRLFSGEPIFVRTGPGRIVGGGDRTGTPDAAPSETVPEDDPGGGSRIPNRPV
jgi:hypothetical protein